MKKTICWLELMKIIGKQKRPKKMNIKTGRKKASDNVRKCIKLSLISGPKMDIEIRKLRHAMIIDFWRMSLTKCKLLRSTVRQQKQKTVNKNHFKHDASKWVPKRARRGPKRESKSTQKWVLEHVRFNGDFLTRLVQVRSKWHHPNDLFLWGYVREPMEGEQATHAC